MNADHVTPLVDALEEVLWAEGILPMYQFAWNARGLHIPAEEIPTVCQEAYDELSRRHTFTRQWFSWPIVDVTAGRPMENDTPFDFDLDHTQDVSVPLQVLVPEPD